MPTPAVRSARRDRLQLETNFLLMGSGSGTPCGVGGESYDIPSSALSFHIRPPCASRPKSVGQRLPDRRPRLQGIGHDISHAQELMDHARIDLQIDGNAGGAEPCCVVAPLIHQGIIFGKHDERRGQP